MTYHHHHHLRDLAAWLDRETKGTACRDALAGAEGKDLSRVVWRFLGAILRELVEQEPEVQAVVDPVIAGMDRVAHGEDWPEARAARAAAWDASSSAAGDGREAASAAAWAAACAAAAAARAAEAAPAFSWKAAWAMDEAAQYAEEAGVTYARQREILLQLMEDA